ncbi:hypothetical protein [Neorhodopirellula lusitana]|uniref:hypothetical protein n=1 Tax=Neorhodopirellula lusitana TaxID=445327 RepID=UPI00384EC7C8
MRKPRDDGEDDGGLDSLLDTMTNVVGILVLVLIVTQMSVADVVTRITTENKIDENAVQELQKELEQLQEQESELEQVLINPDSVNIDRQREELRRQKELLQRRKELIKQREKEKNEYSIKIEQDKKQADQSQQQVEAAQNKREELETLITESLQKKATLEAKLARTPKTEAPADIEVSIPDPRPAPPGAKELTVLCTGDEIFLVNFDAFRETAKKRAMGLAITTTSKREPEKGIDVKKFTERWERMKDQDDFFDVEYYVQNERFPRLRMKPRKGRGASAAELLNPRSRVRKAWLSQIDITKYYARFNVMPDSFAVYAVARRFFTESGMLSGWTPQSDSYELTSWVPGGMELGPPRPKPPPKPTDPNASPPKPPNVID